MASAHHRATTPQRNESLGVIGLGLIGSVWARHYADSGVLAATWNRSPKADVPRAVESARKVASSAHVLHLVVADPPAVEQILTAIEPELGAEHLVLQSSTIDPESSRRFSARVKARGASYVEAPFMGSRPAAEQKKVVLMLGGEEPAVARAEPIVRLLTEQCFRVGDEAQAAALKLSFNLYVAINMEGICESLNLARQSGLSEESYFRILEKTALWSGFLAMKEPKLRRDDFAPQFSIKHMLKDVRLATALAQAGSTPLGVGVLERLRQSAERGLTEEDLSALIKTL
jgi:3-hydroxyisobutyrate dehydrogenase-like beta-hydroxyacid dehydrogenase